MSPETPLDVLIGLAQKKLDDAGRVLAGLGIERKAAQGQLGTLDDYRLDYARRLQRTTQDGLSATNYRNFRQFIATLDEAIRQQNRVIAQIDLRLEAGRKQWYEEKQRLRSYEALRTRRIRQLQVLDQRQEQRASDEAAASLLRRSRSSNGIR